MATPAAQYYLSRLHDVSLSCMQENGGDSVLHVATFESAYARQDLSLHRQSTEQQQQQQAAQQPEVKAAGHAKLELLSRAASADSDPGGCRQSGKIHVALESWISRAMSKAKTRARS